MLPLSTPTTSGFWVDGLSLAIVLAGVCAFAYGLVDLNRRFARPRQPAIDAVTLGAYGALALVALSVIVMMAGGPGIPVAQAVFLMVSMWGVARASVRVPRLWAWVRSVPGGDLARRAALCGRDVLGRSASGSTSFNSRGAARVYGRHRPYGVHLRILQAGVPTLGRVPIGFSNVFGVELFAFYPTGTHALMAITSGFWGQWGLISHAGILKAWFTLTVAAAPWALFWVARRLMPRMPWWAGLALVFVAMPGFRFPIEAAHEGGASRLIAHVLLVPIYADVLLGRFRAPRSWPIAPLLLGMAFLMHPSAFVTLAAVLAYAVMCSAAEDGAWRARLPRIAGGIAVLALGALVAAGLVAWNAGVADVRDPSLPFSWPALLSRWHGGWTTLFEHDYDMAALKRWLIGLGLVLLIVRRKALGLSWRVALFPGWMVLIALLALGTTAAVAGLPADRRGVLGRDASRDRGYAEAIGLTLAVVVWSLWRLAGASRTRWLAPFVAMVLVAGAFGYQLSRGQWGAPPHRPVGSPVPHIPDRPAGRARRLDRAQHRARRDPVLRIIRFRDLGSLDRPARHSHVWRV